MCGYNTITFFLVYTLFLCAKLPMKMLGKAHSQIRYVPLRHDFLWTSRWLDLFSNGCSDYSRHCVLWHLKFWQQFCAENSSILWSCATHRYSLLVLLCPEDMGNMILQNITNGVYSETSLNCVCACVRACGGGGVQSRILKLVHTDLYVYGRLLHVLLSLGISRKFVCF